MTAKHCLPWLSFRAIRAKRADATKDANETHVSLANCANSESRWTFFDIATVLNGREVRSAKLIL